MNDKPFVSVIVPIYGVEAYLEHCVDTLLNQSYQNYEIILVDDGSPDRCPAMCDAYAAAHERVIALHKENGGLSDARNYGTSHSHGEYVTFVDADDYVSPDYLECLVSMMEEHDADITCARHQNVFDDSGTQPNIAPKTQCIGAEEALERICYGREMSVCAYCKLYKRELAQSFPYPKGKLHEDIAVTYQMMGASQKVVFSTKVIYFYRQRRGSIMHQKLTERHYYGIEAAHEQMLYISDRYPKIAPAGEFKYVQKLVEYMPYFMESNLENRQSFQRIREMTLPYARSVLSDKKVSLQFKYRFLCVLMGYQALRWGWKAADFVKYRRRGTTS